MIPFKLHSSKGVREIAVANCWLPNGDNQTPMTTGQFQEFINWDGQDLVKLFSILSGINAKVLSDTHDYILEEQLIAATRFIYEEPMAFKEAKLPHWIEIEGKQIRIPTLIGGLSIGQNIHARQALDKAKVYEELISFVVALYLQPLYDESDFDYHRAVELEQKILLLPISKTYPIGFFLLKKLMPHGSSMWSNVSRLIARLLTLSIRREAT